MTNVILSSEIEKAISDLRAAIVAQIEKEKAAASTQPMAASMSSVSMVSAVASEPAIPTTQTPNLGNNHLDEPFVPAASEPMASAAAMSLPDLPASPLTSLVTPAPAVASDNQAGVAVMPQPNLEVAAMEIPVPEPTALDEKETSAPTGGLSKANSLLDSVRRRGWSSKNE